MEHSLSIITNGIGAVSLKAEITDIAGPPYLVFPDSFEGRLLATNDQTQEFQFGEPGLRQRRIALGGKRYRFAKLEKDGKFGARKDW